jgi:hypothetical protein
MVPRCLKDSWIENSRPRPCGSRDVYRRRGHRTRAVGHCADARRIPVAEILRDRRRIFDSRGDRNGKPRLELVENFCQVGRMCLIDREDDRLANRTGRIFLRFLQERLAHHLIARWRENFSLQIYDLEVFFLLVDDDRPAILSQRLCRDV